MDRAGAFDARGQLPDMPEQSGQGQQCPPDFKPPDLQAVRRPPGAADDAIRSRSFRVVQYHPAGKPRLEPR